jgi:YfiH family protein
VRLPEPFRSAGEHISIDLSRARAVFTTRHGGVSDGPYESLNLGRLTDDDPRAVDCNRERLALELGVRFAHGLQVHGPTVVRVQKLSQCDGDPPQADGQATNLDGVGALVLTADCMPIAIAAAGAVAMVHAGWRGLHAGVIAEGVRAVRELGGEGPAAAAIGPAAGVCCYEVGEEVHDRFSAYGGEARRGRNLDLKAIARRELQRAGVEVVHDVGLCTICSRDFFSHRRDHGITGRQAGIAWSS